MTPGLCCYQPIPQMRKLIHSSLPPSIYSSIHASLHPFIHPCLHSFIHLFIIYLLINILYLLLFIHPSMPPCIYPPTHPCKTSCFELSSFIFLKLQEECSCLFIVKYRPPERPLVPFLSLLNLASLSQDIGKCSL